MFLELVVFLCYHFWKKNIIIHLLFQVLIHLLDDTTEKGILINYHKHYNIALFEVVVKTSAELPLSTELIEYGQEVFLIGRDENLNLNASHGKVERIDGGLFDHFHFMYVDCGVAKVLM